MLSSLRPESVLSALLSRGGEYGELFREEVRSLSVQREDGKVERVLSGTDAGIGIRLLFRGKTFHAYTNECDGRAVLSLAHDLSRYADGGGVSAVLPASPAAARGPSAVRIPPGSREVGEKVALVDEMDRIARGISPEIRQVRATYGEAERRIEVAAHPGVFASDAQTFTLLTIQCVAGNGSGLTMGYETGGGTCGWEFLEEFLPEALARKAAERAVRGLTARRIGGGRMPVVLSSEAGGTMVHEAIGHGLEADLARRGMSVYRDSLGKPVASPLVSIVDDATVPGRRGSFGIDDEGTPGQRTVLVEGGILKGFLYDRLLAMKEEVRSTGNGRRESYRHKPMPRMTNTIILPGRTPPEEIERSVPRGLFVRKMGGGQVNPVTGDFMFEVAEGYRIENGRRGEPVRGATITGNGLEALSMIDMVGSDLGFGLGTCGKEGQGVPVGDAQPTLRFGPPYITVG
ncbi:MAG TPA: TldD/PmbA family protein [Candidatus Deferrimicrobiaceae bacterium]|nr:TldD/PmbA family protein [Candidatus Deferrimicrobiaceae bacterium]